MAYMADLLVTALGYFCFALGCPLTCRWAPCCCLVVTVRGSTRAAVTCCCCCVQQLSCPWSICHRGWVDQVMQVGLWPTCVDGEMGTHTLFHAAVPLGPPSAVAAAVHTLPSVLGPTKAAASHSDYCRPDAGRPTGLLTANLPAPATVLGSHTADTNGERCMPGCLAAGRQPAVMIVLEAI